MKIEKIKNTIRTQRIAIHINELSLDNIGTSVEVAAVLIDQKTALEVF